MSMELLMQLLLLLSTKHCRKFICLFQLELYLFNIQVESQVNVRKCCFQENLRTFLCDNVQPGNDGERMFKSIGMYYPEYSSLSEKLNLQSLEEAPIWKQFGISQYQNILLQ